MTPICYISFEISVPCYSKLDVLLEMRCSMISFKISVVMNNLNNGVLEAEVGFLDEERQRYCRRPGFASELIFHLRFFDLIISIILTYHLE